MFDARGLMFDVKASKTRKREEMMNADCGVGEEN
jgi:hypothetical protein